MPKTLTVGTEIRFVGLKRNGNHAIINWILQQAAQAGNDTLFLNAISINENPFSNPRFPKKMSGGHVDFLLRSFEDKRLNILATDFVERARRSFVESAERRIDILLLRDPYNLFASRLHSGRMWTQSGISVPHMWMMYAREFLGFTDYLSFDKVVISYNRWCTDQFYRRCVAERLGLEFSDAGFEEVADHGGGSSFDGLSFDAKASEMQVLRRWREVAELQDYQRLFRDRMILDLSDRIFGALDGVDEAYKEKLRRQYSSIAIARRIFVLSLLMPAAALRFHLKQGLGLVRFNGGYGGDILLNGVRLD